MREPETSAASSWMDEEEEKRRGLSPIRAFVLLLFVFAFLVGIGLIAMSNKDRVPSDQAIPTTNNFALTNEQAIARFKELDTLREKAYVTRDLSLLSAYVAEGSPLMELGTDDITTLREDHVTFDPKSETQSLRLITNSTDKITIRQVVVQDPQFVSESGDDVSKSNRPIRLVIDWELSLDGSVWKLYDSQLVESEKV